MKKLFVISLLGSLISFSAFADNTRQYVERPVNNPVYHHGNGVMMLEYTSNLVPYFAGKRPASTKYVAVFQGTDFSPKDTPFVHSTYNSKLKKYEHNAYRTW